MVAIPRLGEPCWATMLALARLLQPARVAGTAAPHTPLTPLPAVSASAGAQPLAQHSLAQLSWEAPVPRTVVPRLLACRAQERRLSFKGRAGHALLHFIPVSGGHRLTGAFSQNKHVRIHISWTGRFLQMFKAVGVVYTWAGVMDAFDPLTKLALVWYRLQRR